MTDERFEELKRSVRRPDAHGFRSECAELLAEVERLRELNDRMRSLRVVGDYGPALVADTCDAVARVCDSSLHEVAGRMLRDLMQRAARAEDAAADRAHVLALLKRLTGNDDTRCRPDHHGYCQEHNFAHPCPVPEAHKLTGGGYEYIPRCAKTGY